MSALRKLNYQTNIIHLETFVHVWGSDLEHKTHVLFDKNKWLTKLICCLLNGLGKGLFRLYALKKEEQKTLNYSKVSILSRLRFFYIYIFYIASIHFFFFLGQVLMDLERRFLRKKLPKWGNFVHYSHRSSTYPPCWFATVMCLYTHATTHWPQ